MTDTWVCSKRIFKDTWIKTLRSKSRLQITDGTVPGLYLRYSPTSNAISFYLACRNRISGKRQNVFLGKWIQFENIEEVKKRALIYREVTLKGESPEAVKRERIRKIYTEMTQHRKFDDVFSEYMEKYAKLYKKESTYKSNEAQHKLYLQPIFGDLYMDTIEDKDVLDAYAKWSNDTSFSTANKALSLLSHFWDWCESYKYVTRESNPCKYVKKGKNKKIETRVLSVDEYKALFQVLDSKKDKQTPQSYFRLIKVLALTGCRCSEIRELKIEELDLGHKQLRLEDSKTGARTVKLSDAAVAELEIALADAKKVNSKYVFPCKKDPMTCVQDIRKPFMWALEKAGIPQMRIHDLRHSFISMGANTGQNMVAMRDAAGHSRITTTEGYTHLADEQTFQAVNNIANVICA